MSGLGILGGIAGGFTSARRGILDDQAIRDAEEDRDYTRQQRAEQERDRQFQLGQRQRLLDEQGRVDRIREAEKQIPTTRNTTVAEDQLQEDAAGNTFMAPAQVSRDMPAPKWLQIRQRADIYRKEGDLNTADALEEASRRAQFAEGAQRFEQVRAGAGSMSIAELAQALQGIYNSDPIPTQVTGYEPTKGGGIRVRVRNTETGRDESFEAKSKEDLLGRAEAYFSPQTYSAWVAQQRASALKTQEALLKPEKLGPGDVQVSGGRIIARNDTPTAAQLRGGAGAGGARGDAKETSPMKPFEDAWKATIESADAKFGGPDQASKAREIGRQIFSDGIRTGAPVDPQIAISIASAVASGQKAEQLFFNPETGEFVRGVEHNGRRFTLRELGAPGPRKSNAEVDDKQAELAAASYLQSLPEAQRERMLMASFDKNARQQLRNELEANMRSQAAVAALAQRLGRAPTKADIDAAIGRADNLVQRHLDLIGNYGDPNLKLSTKKKLDPKPQAPGLGMNWQASPGLGNTAAEMLNAGF